VFISNLWPGQKGYEKVQCRYTNVGIQGGKISYCLVEDKNIKNKTLRYDVYKITCDCTSRKNNNKKTAKKRNLVFTEPTLK
jgi:hypothetical protein